MSIHKTHSAPSSPFHSAQSISRRDLLKGTAATAAALGLAGTSVFSPGRLVAQGKESILSACHWGVFHGQVAGGRIAAFTPWKGDPQPSPQLAGVRDSIYSESRIRYPMVREAWLKQGPGADPAGRGSGDFVRVSWDKAIELVAAELTRVRKTYGGSAVFAGSYGWKSPGRVHNCKTLLRRMLNVTGGGYTISSGDYSTGAAQIVLPYVSGSLEVYEQCTTWDNIAKHTKLFVLWGANPLNNSQISWQVADHGAWPGIEALKASGAEVISIDPIHTETCKALNGEWLTIRPQTDVALMLGIAHTLYTQGWHDQKFLDDYTVGFAKFLPYLIGTSDGTPKDAQWAANICGMPADTISALARRFSENRTMLALGYATQRQHYGEQSHWALITLAAMLGQIGLPGGGYGLSYHYASGGAPTHTSPILGAMSDASGEKNEGAAWLSSSGAVSIPVSRLVETLLNPGKTMNFNGQRLTLPLIKMAYWAGGNPFSHHQDRNEMLRAWRKLDTFVVQDFQWTASARHADIVLPATTSYERNDIEQVGDYALSHIVAMKQLVKPLFEARNDFDIFADIAAKLGRGFAFTKNLTEMDWIRYIYEGAKLESRAKGMEMPVFDVFWNSNKPLAFPLAEAQKDFVRHADFRKEPLLNALGTPSGKFELYSNTIASYGYEDCPPHATWFEPIERLGQTSTSGAGAQYPLHVTSDHPRMRLHSQLCGTVNRESYAIADREPCRMNPKDAQSRGLKDGDVVRIYNKRGQILAGLQITEDIMPGVVSVNEGGWFDPLNPREEGSLCVYGDVNVLTTGIATSQLSQGNCGHTAMAQVERYRGKIPPVRVFSQPV